MANKRVRVGGIYIYHPNLLDRVDGRTDLKEGEVVRVVNRYGCPPANTMGHCYVETIENDRTERQRGGLVATNSLHTKDEYITYLRNRIAAHSENPDRKFQVQNGREIREFATLAAAKEYCEDVHNKTGVILSIVTKSFV